MKLENDQDREIARGLLEVLSELGPWKRIHPLIVWIQGGFDDKGKPGDK